MPKLLEKADPSARAGGGDSTVVDEEHALFEVEEEEEMEEDEEEEEESGSEGEGKGVDDVEEEGVEEEVEDEDVGGEGEGEDGEEVEEDGVDREEEVDDFEEEPEEGGDNEEQETEEVEEVEEVEEEEEEEEDDGDGVQEEIDEENMEVEKGEENEEEGSLASSTEAAITAQQDAQALCKMMKSEVNDRDLNSTTADWNDEKSHAHDPSKIFSTCSRELNGTSVGNDTFQVAAEHVPSVENGIPGTLFGETSEGVQLEKDICSEAPEHVKNICLESHGSFLSLGSDDVRSLQPLKNDSVIDVGARSEPEIVKYDVSEKLESHLHGKTDSQLVNPTITCSLTPQRRPRSSSPDSEPDKMNKRLESICVFYARGWCIKGKSCKFLHQKDGDGITEQQGKEDRAGYSRTTGSEEMVEGPKQASVLLDFNSEVSLGCNSLLQRALVRTYGTGSHVSSHPHDPYDIHTKGELQKPDHFQPGCTSTQEEYRKPFGKSYFESVLERQSNDAFLSRRHLTEGKIVNEVPMEDSPYETTVSRRTYPVDAFAPESKHYSDSFSMPSILHQDSSPSAYGRTEGSAIRNARSNFPNQDSYNSHSLSGPLNSGLSDSFQLPQLDYRLSRGGKAPTFGSTRNTEYLDGHNLLDFDRRYRRNYSPDHPQSELRNMIHHDVPGDLRSRQTKIQYNTWEPSQPFRSSLAGSKSLSSPASQYDPILDSIEPASSNARDYCFPTSQMTSFHDASFYPTKTDNAVPWEGTLARNVSLHDSNAHAASDNFFSSTKLEGGNSSLHNYEKVWNPDVLDEKLNGKGAELGSEWRNLDKNRNSKESKAYRIFHSALVDFVKDLVKPYWREGQVTKDSHKTIVKKSVEKVLSALQSHQVPSTQEAINQYLTASKPKLLKLVEGYVQKHANP